MKNLRRIVLTTVLLAVTGGVLSACAVYADGPYRGRHHHGWNDRDYRHDHRR